MLQKSPGKLSAREDRISQLLSLAPWLSFFAISLPVPIVFLFLFLTAATTDAAAIYLLLTFVSTAFSLVVGLLVVISLLLYRRRWHRGLRNRLAADGITAAEVPWFISELSSEERRIWQELKLSNPLLADAYCETLAARLTATRVIARARAETLKVERQINRTRNIRDVDTTKLLEELMSDHQRLVDVRSEATIRLSESKARLQTIEATANRSLNQVDTDRMLRRLESSQEHFPLSLEMSSMEQDALRELEARHARPNHSAVPHENGGLDSQSSSEKRT